MSESTTRRELLTGSAAILGGAAMVGALGGGFGGVNDLQAADTDAADAPNAPRKFGPGTVTYMLGAKMTLDELIAACEKTGLAAVELRSTHAHGVEPDISKQQRKAVRDRFARTKVKLFGLGSACEYHSDKADVVKQNIALSKRFIELAADVGATGVKVRPNGFVRGVPETDTLKQIGHALQEVGQHAARHDVEVWVEVHGRGTSHPPHMKTIMNHCGHPAVGVTWNCNPGDIKDGSIREYFNLLAKHILCVHVHDLYDGYPYRELFTLLRSIGYDRYTLAECPGSSDPVRVMAYFKGLWEVLSAA